MNTGKQASREDVLNAIQQCKPWGSGLSADDVIVISAQAYPVAPGMPRVAVFRRDTKECIYSGGPKGANYKFVEWAERVAEGRNPVGFGLGLQGSLTLYRTMRQHEVRTAADLLDRLKEDASPLLAQYTPDSRIARIASLLAAPRDLTTLYKVV